MIALLPKKFNGLLFAKHNILSYHTVSCFVFRRFFSSDEGKFVPSPVIFDVLLHKHQFSTEFASKVASVLNRLENPENSDSVLSFLKESGFSNAQLEKILNYNPKILTRSLVDSIQPKIRCLKDLGLCSDDTAHIISNNPVILWLNLNTRVIPSFTMLKDLLRTNDAVATVLRKSTWFLSLDLNKTLVPNIEFLKSFGIRMDRILTLLYRKPRYLLSQPGVLKKCAEKAEEMGADRSSDMFIYAIEVLSGQTNQNWELKLQALRNSGFSESDIAAIFRKAPKVLGGSAEKLIRAKDFILGSGKYNMTSIVNNASCLAYSIERRYEPRFKTLEILERKNLIEVWPALGGVVIISDKKFIERYVDPYKSEVGEVSIANSCSEAMSGTKLETLA